MSTSAAVSAPKPRASTAATVDTAAPIPCAKRFGGPATYLGGPRRGATTVIATRPSGLSLGPVRTRAQKPYAIGTSSQWAPVSRIATARERHDARDDARGLLVDRVGEAEHRFRKYSASS